MATAFPSEKGRSPQDQSADIIGYVRHMLGELRTMAASQREELLVYLIEMAAVEAGDIVSRNTSSYREVNGNKAAGMAVKATGKI
ncbi:hypothetical protein QO002_002460 [Pararhizobium capsulatum DSM 1112]|uniref:Uncharacterized protein n=1 Tax=Pararhizobium capsulatum DSM 1112 TaxID=1121113 RepID=A0ABU0BQ04_9HYPH|nr:hypothetical protein [Pararhizobium capsulatum]MDQ0320322.1 hypothetical protein [Pararhizobium capsulatum DSM 1112]